MKHVVPFTSVEMSYRDDRGTSNSEVGPLHISLISIIKQTHWQLHLFSVHMLEDVVDGYDL